MICPECGAENGRFALRCNRCRSALPHGLDRWLTIAGIALAALALLLLLARTGVLRSPGPARPEADGLESTPTGVSASQDAELMSEPEGFVLTPPGAPWRLEDPSRSELAETGIAPALSLVREGEPAYGAVLGEPTQLSPGALADLALDRLAVRSESFALLRRRTILLDGESAEEAEFTLKSGGLRIHYLATFAVRKGLGYQLLFWSMDRDFPAVRQEFERIRTGWHWAEGTHR